MKTIQTNEQNFDTDVLHARQPVLVDFWAEWCGPCKMLAPVLDEIAHDHADRLKVVKVNIDENPLLTQRYRITSIPTLLYFSDGVLRDQTIGAASKKAIVSKLDRLPLAVS